MKTIGRLKALFFAASFAMVPYAFGGEVVYKIGSHEFNVPTENIPDLSPWGWIKSVAGLEQDVESFIFEFSGENIGSVIEEYLLKNGTIDQKVIGAVYLISAKERNDLSSARTFSDIWYAKNGYENREVVLDEDSGFYFAYEREGYRGMFYVLSKPPASTPSEGTKDILLAVCSGASVTELKHVSCTSQFLFKSDLMVEFSISLKNLKSQPQVKSFLKDHFTKWLQ